MHGAQTDRQVRRRRRRVPAAVHVDVQHAGGSGQPPRLGSAQDLIEPRVRRQLIGAQEVRVPVPRVQDLGNVHIPPTAADHEELGAALLGRRPSQRAAPQLRRQSLGHVGGMLLGQMRIPAVPQQVYAVGRCDEHRPLAQRRQFVARQRLSQGIQRLLLHQQRAKLLQVLGFLVRQTIDLSAKHRHRSTPSRHGATVVAVLVAVDARLRCRRRRIGRRTPIRRPSVRDLDLEVAWPTIGQDARERSKGTCRPVVDEGHELGGSKGTDRGALQGRHRRTLRHNSCGPAARRGGPSGRTGGFEVLHLLGPALEERRLLSPSRTQLRILSSLSAIATGDSNSFCNSCGHSLCCLCCRRLRSLQGFC
mmetsp:Transcript_52515/g.170597  ORF Transcript_52515/g.170597 Transcript_52515/m.170597 type:complete len:363 (-) Transcript_52515:150-1238(-)